MIRCDGSLSCASQFAGVGGSKGGPGGRRCHPRRCFCLIVRAEVARR